MKINDFSVCHASVFGLVYSFGLNILKLELNKNKSFFVPPHFLLQSWALFLWQGQNEGRRLLSYIFKEMCRSIYFQHLANLMGEASFFTNTLQIFLYCLQRYLWHYSGEDWQVDEIILWLFKSAYTSAISTCDGSICIAWPSFPITSSWFTVLFSHDHDAIMMAKRCFKANCIELIWSESFKSHFSLSFDGKKILS